MLKAKSAYESGKNIIEQLSRDNSVDASDRTVIELAYDLQAGSYIRKAKSDSSAYQTCCDEMSEFLAQYVGKGELLLDVGTGELTTLSMIMAGNSILECEIYAFDLSWSRLAHGLPFWEEVVGGSRKKPTVFCADMFAIPLRANAVDVVTSAHALEPNGNDLRAILEELFRICRKKLVLFEPSYELNTDEGKARMDRHGYIKGLEETVESLGGAVMEVTPLRHPVNPLNPTVCYVIDPPETDAGIDGQRKPVFTAPGSELILSKSDGYFISPETGLVFPSLAGIPILKTEAAIIATSFATCGDSPVCT